MRFCSFHYWLYINKSTNPLLAGAAVVVVVGGDAADVGDDGDIESESRSPNGDGAAADDASGDGLLSPAKSMSSRFVPLDGDGALAVIGVVCFDGRRANAAAAAAAVDDDDDDDDDAAGLAPLDDENRLRMAAPGELHKEQDYRQATTTDNAPRVLACALTKHWLQSSTRCDASKGIDVLLS